MSVKTLQGYMALCRYYRWTPSWDGLKTFAKGDRNKMLGGAREL